MKLLEDYILRDDLIKDTKDTVAIELTSGPYAGTIYRYTTVAIKEPTDGSEARIKFAYDILDKGKAKNKGTLKKDKLFNEHIGLILNALILESVGADDNRKGNPQESTNE